MRLRKSGELRTNAEGRWFCVPIDDEWEAHYRVMRTQEDNRLIFAEVRVFPQPPIGYEETAGIWPGAMGEQAQIPAGGLIQKLLVGLKIHAHKDEALKQLQHQLDGPIGKWEGQIAEELGLPYSREILWPQLHRPGRAGKGELFYLEVAEEFAMLLNRPGIKSPTKALAERRKTPLPTVREWLRKACRVYGFLKEPPGEGVTYGGLTEKARRTRDRLGRRKP